MQSLRRQGFEFYDKVTGHDILSTLDKLDRTQWLSSDELETLQMRRLQSLLEYACMYVPHYRRLFDQIGFRPGDLESDPASFQRIPPVSKAYIRDHADEFFTTEPGRRKGLSQDATTGSTGEPFIFWEDRHCQNCAVASTLRHHTWCGWQPGQLRLYLWGIPYDMTLKQKLRLKARNLAWNLVFANAFNPSDENMSDWAELIRKRKPKLLHGYASALYSFAYFVHENGWDDVRLPAVYPTSGVLYSYQRELIEEAFQCQVFDRYATQEVSGIACECEAHTGMHLCTETNYVEILDENNIPAKDGEAGNVVVTNLTNYVFPFIRYHQGDIARISTRQCTCGRGQPMLEKVEGRVHEMFRTSDGRQVALWGIDYPFRDMEGVRKFQLVQKSLDHIVVRVVKDGPMNQTQRAAVEKVITLALGDQSKIDYEFPDEIPPARSGKHRYLICEID